VYVCYGSERSCMCDMDLSAHVCAMGLSGHVCVLYSQNLGASKLKGINMIAKI
jgi:hypothetical protein